MSSEKSEDESFLDNILKPGSSLHHTFLFILDGAFACLLFVLLGLAYLTSGNIHCFMLISIELALWASVKWFVSELKAAQLNLPVDNDKKTS